MTELALFAERLRAARTERGLSLSALAAAAGIGKGSLSELESGQRNPTLATLYALAGPLGLPLATLLGDRTGTEVSADGLVATLLDTSAGDGRTVEVYRLDFAAGADRRSPRHGDGVREHLVVTAGRLAVSHPAGTAELGPGDSTSFTADGPHRYRPLGAEPATAVLVITSPLRGSGHPGRSTRRSEGPDRPLTGR